MECMWHQQKQSVTHKQMKGKTYRMMDGWMDRQAGNRQSDPYRYVVLCFLGATKILHMYLSIFFEMAKMSINLNLNVQKLKVLLLKFLISFPFCRAYIHVVLHIIFGMDSFFNSFNYIQMCTCVVTQLSPSLPHIRMVLSPPHEASSVPVGFHATHHTLSW